VRLVPRLQPILSVTCARHAHAASPSDGQHHPSRDQLQATNTPKAPPLQCAVAAVASNGESTRRIFLDSSVFVALLESISAVHPARTAWLSAFLSTGTVQPVWESSLLETALSDFRATMLAGASVGSASGAGAGSGAITHTGAFTRLFPMLQRAVVVDERTVLSASGSGTLPDLLPDALVACMSRMGLSSRATDGSGAGSAGGSSSDWSSPTRGQVGTPSPTCALCHALDAAGPLPFSPSEWHYLMTSLGRLMACIPIKLQMGSDLPAAYGAVEVQSACAVGDFGKCTTQLTASLAAHGHRF
jgi:hypothetical protein